MLENIIPHQVDLLYKDEDASYNAIYRLIIQRCKKYNIDYSTNDLPLHLAVIFSNLVTEIKEFEQEYCVEQLIEIVEKCIIRFDFSHPQC